MRRRHSVQDEVCQLVDAILIGPGFEASERIPAGTVDTIELLARLGESTSINRQLEESLLGRIRTEIVEELPIERRRRLTPLLAGAVGIVLAGIVIAVAVILTARLLFTTGPIEAFEALTVKMEGSPPALFPLEGLEGEEIDIEVSSEYARHLSWSPDGRYLAYGKDFDLWLYDSQSSESFNLTNTPDRAELAPTWSPDGNALSFTSSPLGVEESETGPIFTVGQEAALAVINRDGTGYETLASGPLEGASTWSEDGERLAYAVGGEIRILTLETGDVDPIRPVDLGAEFSYLTAPAWSPAGDEIAFFFSSAGDGSQGYGIVSVTTREARVIKVWDEMAAPGDAAIWNPAGTRLLLTILPTPGAPEPAGLWLVERDGSREQFLGVAYQAAWSSDGAKIAFVDLDNRRLVRLIDASDPSQQETRTYAVAVEGIAWKPK